MKRRQFIKMTSTSLALTAIAGCGSTTETGKYNESALTDMDEFPIDYTKILRDRANIVRRTGQAIADYGCKLSLTVDSENETQEISFRNEPNKESLLTKTVKTEESVDSKVTVYSTNNYKYYRIDNPDKTDFNRESVSSVNVFTGNSVILNWLDNMEVEHKNKSETASGITIHKYDITTYNSEEVEESSLVINDRGVILEFYIKLPEYTGRFEVSNFNSVQLSVPSWISLAEEELKEENEEYESEFFGSS